MMNENTLFVDDDQNILSAFKRYFRNEIIFDTASSGQDGLDMLRDNGPFAVVVADMRMPKMDGIEFLKRVKERYPDIVRIMLTGNADMQTAINAVNEGNIFRFLTKPTSKNTIIQTVTAAIEQYKLIHAEKELLEKTLRGSIAVLTEILSMVNPAAFAQSQRIMKYIRYTVEQFELPDAWQLEIATMLSQIGCVAIPPDILEKKLARETLTEYEENLYSSHPLIAKKLLTNIPRMENIITIIEKQDNPIYSEDYTIPDIVILGSQILNVALALDRLIVAGNTLQKAITILKGKNHYPQQVIEKFEKYSDLNPEEQFIIKDVMVKELRMGMILEVDIKTIKGALVAPKGQEVTYPLLSRIKNFAEGAGIIEPIRIKFFKEQ